MSYLITLIILSILCRIRAQTQNVYVESPAVAVQFPDPDYELDTPAFQKASVNFTSQPELLSFIDSLTAISDDLQVHQLGNSQDGHAIMLLKFGKKSRISGEGPTVEKTPSILIIGQQHGNEHAGGEAALAIASELAKNSSLLEHLDILIVPRANPDGASRSVRGLTNGDDVNRDHLLLQSPEGEALARVFREYNPEIVMDCHEFSVNGRYLTKFDGLQKADGLLQHATVSNLAGALNATATIILQKIRDKFEENQLSTDWYYTTTLNNSDKVVAMGGVVPDTGRNIAGLRNSLSFLLETRGIGIGKAHFKRRVFTHLMAIRAILEYAATNPEVVMTVRRNSDAEVVAAAGKGTITVVGSQTPERRSIILLDPDTGTPKTIEVQWNSALNISSDLTRSRPFGYLLKSTETHTANTLRRLGVTVKRTCGILSVEQYSVISVEEVKKADVTGSVGTLKDTVLRMRTELNTVDLPVDGDDFYVPLDQALGNIVVAALEPESQSSFPANYFLSQNVTQGLTLSVYRVVARKPKTEFAFEYTSSCGAVSSTQRPVTVFTMETTTSACSVCHSARTFSGYLTLAYVLFRSGLF